MPTKAANTTLTADDRARVRSEYLARAFDSTLRGRMGREAASGIRGLATLAEWRGVNLPYAIAFRGLSGGLLAPTVADRLHVGLIGTRPTSESEHAHSGMMAEGHIAAPAVVIVDDFVDSGRTVHEIMESIIAERAKNDIWPARPVLLGVYSYDWGRLTFPADITGFDRGRLGAVVAGSWDAWLDRKWSLSEPWEEGADKSMYLLDLDELRARWPLDYPPRR